MHQAAVSPVQQRVVLVLERIKAMVLADADDAEMFADMLEAGLADLHGQDAFGTEGQCDPRGDFRNGDWSMSRVEDLDA